MHCNLKATRRRANCSRLQLSTSLHLTLPQPPLDSATAISSRVSVHIFWWLVGITMTLTFNWIWPGHFNTIGQYAAELLTIRSIFTARYSVGTIFGLPIFQSWKSDHIKFGEEIGQSLALPMHSLDFRYIASFRNQRALNWTRSKIEAKFCIFAPL